MAKMGRPPVEDPRSEAVQVRLTKTEGSRIDEEKEKIAPGAGLSRAAFIRWLLNGYLEGRLVRAPDAPQSPPKKGRRP